MRKSKNKKIYFGLLGYPVKHSLSPIMHTAALKALNIDAEYKLFEVGPKYLKKFISNLAAKNIKGLNVTVPYKEKVFEFVKINKKDNYLYKIGAVNTIVVKDNLYGHNTDIFGFERDLDEKKINVKNKNVVLLGAGGAAKAVVYVLGKKKIKSISIYDIDEKKSVNLANLINNLFPDIETKIAYNIEELEIEKKDILINATPVGLNENDPCLIAEQLLHKNLIVYDLIYNPPKTKLLLLAEKKGLKAYNGLGMLLYQGVLSFEYFTAKRAPIKIMRKALENALSNLCQRK
ncbi:MAG: shikimate dehydrogenase [Candidatus Omnitrophica bacterium]|nr:shikimate dehydrogenase [Candidatus Omnitrophota bacterium]MCM8831565.1 shikimate dehydrogenase [Candidatus Omnitrophota bacterium]